MAEEKSWEKQVLDREVRYLIYRQLSLSLLQVSNLIKASLRPGFKGKSPEVSIEYAVFKTVLIFGRRCGS